MTTNRQSGRNRRNATSNAAKPKLASTASTPAAAASEQSTPAAGDGTYSWTHDYDYVKKDLRKLGIVSGVLFLAILVAGFFM